jgi:hypothetical protein
MRKLVPGQPVRVYCNSTHIKYIVSCQSSCMHVSQMHDMAKRTRRIKWLVQIAAAMS